jgi:hypothetical protein
MTFSFCFEAEKHRRKSRLPIDGIDRRGFWFAQRGQCAS